MFADSMSARPWTPKDDFPNGDRVRVIDTATALKEDAKDDRRQEVVRQHLDNHGPSKSVSFEGAAGEGGWDLDVTGSGRDRGRAPWARGVCRNRNYTG